MTGTSRNNSIHPTAIVSGGAQLGDGVVVGPYVVIEGNVEIGDGTEIGPHAVIHSYVRMGVNNHIFSHAVIGGLPQDISFDTKAETWIVIGDSNILREGVTIHRATDPSRITKLGSDCYMMAYSHVGHDSNIADGVILTNNCCVGGHVEIGRNTVIGGGVMIHQFCRIGTGAMVAGFIALRKDVLPYSMIGGEPPKHYHLNTVGLRRAGINGERYKLLEKAFREVRDGNKSLDNIDDSEETRHLRDWLSHPSKRGLSGFLN